VHTESVFVKSAYVSEIYQNEYICIYIHHSNFNMCISIVCDLCNVFFLSVGGRCVFIIKEFFVQLLL